MVTSSKSRAAQSPRSQVQDSKQNILRAALHLFSTYGYRSVSLDEVAKAAGVTKGAIYHHFKDKEDLLDYTIRSSIQSLERIEEILGAFEGASKKKLMLAVTDAWKRWTDPAFGKYYQLFMGEIASSHPLVFQKWFKLVPLRTWRFWEQIIEEGKRKKEFRRKVNAREMSRLMLTSLSSLAVFQGLVSKRNPEYCPSQQVFESTMGIFMFTLENPATQGK